jgi:UDP-N-acetyl-D-mannosaminuronate dehydrogenase
MEQRVVIVGGCGHVGLPLGIVLASRGVTVTLLDIDAAKIETVNALQRSRRFGAIARRASHASVYGNGCRNTCDGICLRSGGDESNRRKD